MGGMRMQLGMVGLGRMGAHICGSDQERPGLCRVQQVAQAVSDLVKENALGAVSLSGQMQYASSNSVAATTSHPFHQIRAPSRWPSLLTSGLLCLSSSSGMGLPFLPIAIGDLTQMTISMNLTAQSLTMHSFDSGRQIFTMIGTSAPPP